MRKATMQKKLLVSVLSLLAVSIQCMEKPNQQLQQWVVQAKTIRVQNLKGSWNLPIANNTTIENLKEELFDAEGIPTNQQQLRAATINWWKLGLNYNYSDSLPNERNVKQAMNQHNTDLLQLSIILNNSKK